MICTNVSVLEIQLPIPIVRSQGGRYSFAVKVKILASNWAAALQMINVTIAETIVQYERLTIL